MWLFINRSSKKTNIRIYCCSILSGQALSGILRERNGGGDVDGVGEGGGVIPHCFLYFCEGRADCVLEKPRLKTQTKTSVSPDGQGQIPGPRPSQNRFCRPYQTFRHTQDSIPVADDLSCPVACEWKRSLGVSYMDK